MFLTWQLGAFTVLRYTVEMIRLDLHLIPQIFYPNFLNSKIPKFQIIIFL